ncbi:MAG: beta-galactosidase trimerization domain-containing protein [Thermoguttaceae bacterium]
MPISRRMFAWWTCFGIVLAGYVPAARANTTAEEVEEDNSLVSGLITPHKPWGRGYTGGPIRALFLVHSGSFGGDWSDPGTRLREVAELTQRFDLQADAILFGGPSAAQAWQYHGQNLGERRAERLLAKPYQLYVIAGFPLEKLPARHQYLIVEQVAKGAGLLCCGPGAGEYMTPTRRIDPLPVMFTGALPMLDGKSAKDWTTAYRMGRGRGVWLNYNTPSLTPYQEFSWRGLAEYDYRMLLIGRAAIWAAAREGEVSMTTTGSQPLRSSRSQAGGSWEVVLLSKAFQPLKVQVALELRRACDGWTKGLGTPETILTPGQPVRVPVPLPHLRAGDYFIDALVRSQRGIEACGAGSLAVQSDFGVETVELSQPFVERGETIKAMTLLRGTPPAGTILRLRVRDSYDRILRQQDLPVTPGKAEYPFAYRADAFATTLIRIEALLISDGEEVEMKDASFTVPKRRQGQFNFVQWDAPRDVLGYYAWRRLQQAGMNISLIGSMGGVTPQQPVLRACDASLAIYSTRILDEKDASGHMQPVCWNHEPAVTEYVERIVSNQKLLRQQGAFVYSLGDEGATLGCCVHPACLAAYRRYLAAQYGAVEKLNASWGSNYKSFDEVDLLDRKDNMETAAVKTSSARWFDRQAFARVNLAQFSGRFGAAYKRLDPQAVTGFEGTGGFGDDYDAILDANTFYGPYPSIGDDLVRSLAPRRLIRSNWMGYSKTADALADAAWRMVMKGVDSVWYWMWDGVGNWRGYLSPTLDFWPATAEVAEEMRPVRQGLGDLLLQSKMTHSGIAVFYSVPTALSDQVDPGSQFLAAHPTHQAWTQFTYELGLDFRYVSSRGLKCGLLDPREFKVLLLPMAQAISPEEAEAIRRFVQAGGTAIADVRPGIYDGHCRPIAPRPLDDLFGIRRGGRGKATRSPVSVKGSLEGHDVDFQIPETAVDPEVQPAAAQPLGHADKTPLLLVHRVGKGRAILLNFQLPALGSTEQNRQAAMARRLLDWLYRTAGVKALIASTAPDGRPLPLVETRVWENGGALVVGLYRQMQCEWFSPKSGTVAGEPVAAKIVFPAARHVYDLRAGKYLGSVTRVDARLRWGRASFFLAIPYEIKVPQIGLSEAAPAPGRTIAASVRLDVPADVPERHAVWVEITDPQGQQPLWGQQVLVLNHGSGQVQIPVAYNDLPGLWRIRVTELFSQQSAEAAWTVR